MKILFVGGTRFVGKSLLNKLSLKQHDITIFTRGINPVPDSLKHIQGDRKKEESLKLLEGNHFDIIIDSCGRTLEETQTLIKYTGLPKYRFLYISSAGVYADKSIWPLDESCEIDSNSRHFGKYETERWLAEANIPFTSFRPTYIYGPGNYNSIEKWFFDRLLYDRPIPIPFNGQLITQLGHVDDLAQAMLISLDTEVANNKIYNCSGNTGITLTGLAYTAARVCNKKPSEVNFFSYEPSRLNNKSRKVFPLRTLHFLTDINLIKNDLNWAPKYDLYLGLKDSYQNDYLLNDNNAPDFSLDKSLIGI